MLSTYASPRRRTFVIAPDLRQHSGDAVFALAPKALTVGDLGFVNAEVPNVLLPNADVPEPNVEEPNTDIELRFANAPKLQECAATLVFPNGLD